MRLSLPGDTRRKLAVMPTGAYLDENARLLAYLAPWYTKAELPPRDDPRRETFNLQQVRNGWGAFFPIYPSLPGNDDMNRAIEAARIAWETPSAPAPSSARISSWPTSTGPASSWPPIRRTRIPRS